MTNTLKRSAARASAAPAFQSRKRNASAKRPMPAWTALRVHSAGVTAVSTSVRRARRRRRGLLPRPRVLVVPGDVSLQPVLHVARPADPVVLSGVDDELRGHAEAAQRL